MKNGFLKTFGLGLLWALVFPFVLVAILLFAVIGVFIFCYQFILMLIHFFSGKKLFPPFEEDIKALSILQGNIDEEKAKASAPQQSQPQTVIVNQTYYGGHGSPFPPGFQQQQLPPQQGYPNPYLQQQQQYPQNPQIQNNPQNNYDSAMPALNSFPSNDESEGR